MSILKPTKRELEELRQLEELYRGVPFEWRMMTCPGCGAEFATQDGPIIFNPCKNCGSDMSVITKQVETRAQS